MADIQDAKVVKEGVIANEDNTVPKLDKGDDAEKGMNGAVEAKEYYSSSMITDPRKERSQVALVTFASAAAAGSYILMLFIAMPLSIHTIVNGNDGCNVEVDTACFAPTESSQKQLTLALTLLRVSTFLMGSLVGTLSDRFGRKPLLVGALLGYTCAGALFLIGWASKRVGFFLLGSVMLGSSSPVTPHGVAYVSDISVPSRLAINMGYLEGFGYFIGLMSGAILSLIIASLTTGKEETIKTYDQMFYSSYALGLVLSLLSAILMMFFLPESLHPNDRTKNIDIKKANPFGFLPLVTRNMYFFLIWMSGMFAWGSIGSQESAAGGWWLRRYAISDTTQFIQFTVLLWVFSGLGAAICTKLYVSFGGLKFAVHISAIMTIITGITFSLAPTSNLSYITVAFSFFASAVLPTTLAVLMGQVNSKEKGALAGALRSSEALGKFIGIVIVGNTFASYIASFTPDASCIPADHGVNSSNNDCDCGIETCPVFTGELTNLGFPTFKKVPSPCTLGQLSQKLIGKPSKYVEDGVEANMRIIPQLFVDQGLLRPEECLGAGLLPGRGGLTTNVDRAWCISEAAANSRAVHLEFGCQEFDLSKFLTDEIFIACTNITGLEVELECGPVQQLIFSTFPSSYQIKIPEGKLENFSSIRDNILDLDYDGLICEGSSKAKYNICIDGPISSFPGFFPFMFMGLLAVLAYLSFVLAEVCFVKGDQEYWKDHEKELTQVEEITDNKLGV